MSTTSLLVTVVIIASFTALNFSGLWPDAAPAAVASAAASAWC